MGKKKYTPKGEFMINLELKVEEVQLVLGALAQLPYGQVAILLEKIKTQAETQLKKIEKSENI
jgi:hypothetical protein